ncbi:restriction alleviation protein, Lar family [Paraburkholderia tropica]|uniref:Lar family restriction alleviation protein n=1 Tax=Paraburkholderia tropica TaxID=92647 RepID=UPI0016013398|nr:Lar family restriction alleviation protein [Paraburkholderia tropica]QNB13469.1 restriction alleviation protein, Lar family [Paraburkholderia tropica]
MDNQLKPCPFCGSDDTYTDSALGKRQVLCNACEAAGPTEETDDEAIASWNRLAAPVAPAAVAPSVDLDSARAVWNEWLQLRGTDIDFKSPKVAVELVRYAMGRAAPKPTVAADAAAPSDERSDALCDAHYSRGLQAGFSLGQMDDNEGLRKALESREGYLKVLRETSSAAQPDERAAFEAWMLTGELDLTPNLERDGEFYGEFCTQRAWRGWQARAAAPSQVGRRGDDLFDRMLTNKATTSPFHAWFKQAWNAYEDKPITNPITAMAWALKCWEHLQGDRAAAPQAALTDKQIVEFCADFCSANDMDPRTENRMAYALRALIAVAPARTSDAARELTADDADMVWHAEDGETFFHTIDDAVDYEVDQAWPTTGPLELKLSLGKIIPAATVRIFNITENGHEWEIIDAARKAEIGGRNGS